MRWKGRQGSSNIEDRRRMGTPAKVGGGGILSILLIVVVALVLGENPLKLLNAVGPVPPAAVQNEIENAEGSNDEATERLIAAQAEAREFVGVVLKDTEDVWKRLLPDQLGKTYREPKLVLFTGEVKSACGGASSAVGPFYCPGDSKVYLDLSFFEEMRTKFKAPGDFACAYVVAHEVGHHIQNLLGFSMRVQQLQRRARSKTESNQLSVRLELQADLLAGIWAHHAQLQKGILEEGDLEEAIRAANQIGDDTLQRQATGRVVPDAFTHGTSAQRIRWFTRGLRTGDLEDLKLPFDLDYEEL